MGHNGVQQIFKWCHTVYIWGYIYSSSVGSGVARQNVFILLHSKEVWDFCIYTANLIYDLLYNIAFYDGNSPTGCLLTWQVFDEDSSCSRTCHNGRKWGKKHTKRHGLGITGLYRKPKDIDALLPFEKFPKWGQTRRTTLPLTIFSQRILS
jgi:hypothetical protein